MLLEEDSIMEMLLEDSLCEMLHDEDTKDDCIVSVDSTTVCTDAAGVILMDVSIDAAKNFDGDADDIRVGDDDDGVGDWLWVTDVWKDDNVTVGVIVDVLVTTYVDVIVSIARDVDVIISIVTDAVWGKLYSPVKRKQIFFII